MKKLKKSDMLSRGQVNLLGYNTFTSDYAFPCRTIVAFHFIYSSRPPSFSNF